MGVTAVACAVAAPPDQRAAVSVTGPTLRLRGLRLEPVKELVVTASEEVSRRLEALR